MNALARLRGFFRWLWRLGRLAGLLPQCAQAQAAPQRNRRLSPW